MSARLTLNFVARWLMVSCVIGPTLAWNHGSAFVGRSLGTKSASSQWTMRDASASYWFTVGDQIRVTEDVMKADLNLRDRVGVVRETWEKCDVDPTCCCAEQVDCDLAVRVQFEGDGGESFEHYFSEEELVKI